MSNSRSIFLPWGFCTEGALCNGGALQHNAESCIGVVLYRPWGGAPGEIRKLQKRRFWRAEPLTVQQFEAFLFTGKRSGRGINEGSFCSCMKDQSQFVILSLDAQETLYSELWRGCSPLKCTREAEDLVELQKTSRIAVCIEHLCWSV